ncbi:hydroxyethylthiazole kinase [Magnolia sinica]|uniref:hydroxyethylthiazole kinase n=1 Tax=Magnolia sinica TaxID=86752 RepID=UPI002657B4DB|nr:hydroxyethylthiazole kinase [Magnolia sinica]XP_058101323.1 hydroxyethylthiazole kinase [Magnolia sinica]
MEEGKATTTTTTTCSSSMRKEEEENGWWGQRSWKLLTAVRNRAPLIQCITNFVSMDIMANTLLASGASPAMVHCLHEIPDFTPHAHALCINIGTLSPDWIASMKAAASLAVRSGKPWVLDPVAVSASDFRMKACLELVELRPTVIRGNASEIIALSSASLGPTKGVDSSHGTLDAVEAAKSLAQSSGAIVAVSGAVDIITDGQHVVGAHNGVAMMQQITATGCAVTALIAAFVAANPLDAFEATASALSIFGVAGEVGLDMAKGPASLRMHLIDSLHGLDEVTVLSRVVITHMS